MCGIAGFVSFKGHSRESAAARVKAMANSLLHRGPDDGGIFVDDFAALGHRRLSIIDLSAGQQPMGTPDGKVEIVFNGEIYNHLEVRADLEYRGHRFRTHSDTEVLLLAYVEWGDKCVERLHGMFAYAIWDSCQFRLVLGRDRFGKKPLYYCRTGNCIAFASELKALKAGGLCPTQVDTQALDCYLSFGYVPTPRTIYSGVSKLRAAHTLIARESGDTTRRYWQLKFSEQRSCTLAEATDEFEGLLDEAVRCRLMSEVPLGAFLSGGIDSSLVVSSMARLMTQPVITNSIGFNEAPQSELHVAARVARHLGAEHHEFLVTPDAVSAIERIAWHFDEPIADSSALPTWYVCEMTRRHVTVALSGDGGDEAFGGYTFRYLPHVLESRVRAVVPALIRGAVFGPMGAIWPSSAALPKALRLKTIFENLAVGDAEAFYRDLVWLSPKTRAALYTQEFLSGLHGFEPIEDVFPHYGSSNASVPLARCQHADLNFYMTDDVLVKVDRMSMAHSLEIRCPLLDHRIVEFAATLPQRLKMTLRHGKLPLRELASRRLPPDIAALPKKGFSIPAAEWLRKELRPVMEEVVSKGSALPGNPIRQDVLRLMWDQHLKGARDHSVFLWGIMMLALWQRTTTAKPATAA